MSLILGFPPASRGCARAVSVTRHALLAGALGLLVLAAGCGGGGGSEPAQNGPTPVVLSEPGSQTAVAGTSVTFSVGASNATIYQWQKLEGGQWVDIPGAQGASLVLGQVTLTQSGTQYRVVVANDAGSVASSGFTLTVEAPMVAPTLDTPPADTVVVEGASATFSVAARGDELAFAWDLSSDGGATWLPVPGATAATLVLPNLTLADSGKRLRARVGNKAGSVLSRAALLTVTAAPVAPSIATQPVNQSVNPGQLASFGVTALGTDLAYAWQASTDAGATWSPVAGANSTTLALGPVSLADHGRRYRVVISNSVGTVVSAAAQLTVTPAIVAVSITGHPASLIVNEGQTAVFVVVASGSTPTYQWQVNAGAGWVDAGAGLAAQGATLTVPGVALADHGKRFRAVVGNAAGSATSQEALLTVNALVSAPVLTQQPLDAVRIVGQSASFSVAATAKGASPTYQWQARTGGGAWSDISGAQAATYAIGAVAAADAKSVRARVATPAGTVFSNEATLQVEWGSVTPSDDTSTLESFGGGADGGSPGGGDGAGTDGGGGLGRTVNALFTVHRLADGALLGQALTHPITGLVKIKAGPGAAPLLLTMSGNEKARYYDEGKAATGASPVESMLPFGSDQVLHALVDRLDENLGVTPLTEAAYRYAINQFLADPGGIARGATPLRRAAELGELRQLTADQIRQAHAVILKEVNGKLPDIYRLDSLKSLPTPVDGSAGTDVLKLSRYGRQQAVTGGLVTAAGLFKKIDAKQPALALVEQLARDLTDGKLDGYALDGSPAAREGETPVYDAIRLPADLSFGANRQAERFGSVTLYPLVPSIIEVGEQWSTYDNDCPRWRDHVSLLKDGNVRIARTAYSAPKSLPPKCDQTSTTSVTSDFATGVRQLQSNGYQGFLVRSDGGVIGWGNASCGMLGNGMSTGTVDKPVNIAALAKLTSMAIGDVSVAARDAAGQIYTFGSNFEGSLGLGANPTGAENCKLSDSKLVLPSVLTPRPVPRLRDTVSVHVVRGRTFYAVQADGMLAGWGSADALAFGGAVTEPRDTPALVFDDLKGVRTVGGTLDMTFALLTKGVVVGWGLNSGGGFGDGSARPVTTRAAVPLGNGVVQDLVADGLGQAIALLDDGSVIGWGPTFVGIDPLSGRAIRYEQRLPRAVEGLDGVKVRHVQLGNGPDAVIYLLTQDGKVFKLDGQRRPFVAQEVTASFQ